MFSSFLSTTLSTSARVYQDSSASPQWRLSFTTESPLFCLRPFLAFKVSVYSGYWPLLSHFSSLALFSPLVRTRNRPGTTGTSRVDLAENRPSSKPINPIRLLSPPHQRSFRAALVLEGLWPLALQMLAFKPARGAHRSRGRAPAMQCGAARWHVCGTPAPVQCACWRWQEQELGSLPNWLRHRRLSWLTDPERMAEWSILTDESRHCNPTNPLVGNWARASIDQTHLSWMEAWLVDRSWALRTYSHSPS